MGVSPSKRYPPFIFSSSPTGEEQTVMLLPPSAEVLKRNTFTCLLSSAGLGIAGPVLQTCS